MKVAVRSIVVVAAAVCALGGCRTSGPMSIAVRHGGTCEPVPGALVRIVAHSFFLPQEPFDQVNAASPGVVSGRTGADGVVRFEDAPCPADVIVLAPGHVPHSLFIREHPADTRRATEWLDADAGGADGIGPLTLQIRLMP